jgi:hypothetical protein
MPFCYAALFTWSNKVDGISCLTVFFGTMWFATSDDHTVNMTVYFRLIIVGESVFSGRSNFVWYHVIVQILGILILLYCKQSNCILV